jgi:protein gp37
MEGCDGGKVNSHCDLIAWKLGIEFVTDIYQSTQTFPKHEIYGLTSQMRRAAVSVPSNVAEGAGRRSRADFRRFLNVPVTWDILKFRKKKNFLEKQYAFEK